MTPEEKDYREVLRRSGVAVQIGVLTASTRAALDELARSSDSEVATAVRLGVFPEDGVLVLPPDKNLIGRVAAAANALRHDPKLGLMAQINAKDIAIRVSEASGLALSSSVSSDGPRKDPKVEREEILAALEQVGSPKRRQRIFLKKVGSGDDAERVVGREATRDVHRPSGRLTVACGLGVDSVAIIVGLAQEFAATGDERWRPELITFADTGGEHPETYSYIDTLNDYLARVGFPKVTVVAWATEMRGGDDRGGWGTGVTLEINSINNHQVPSISVGGHACSNKFKIQPQQAYLKRHFAGQLGPGESVLRAIGYDSTEEGRLTGGGTYVASKEEEDGTFIGWYPLIEWGWNRARCIAEIAVAFGSRTTPAWGSVPRKSSCYFCGAMTVDEIVMLVESGHKDLLKRAIFMEQVALMNWSHQGPPDSFIGLGRQFAWTDFALARLDKLSPRQRVIIEGGVLRQDSAGSWRSVHVGPPSEYDDIRSTDRIYQPSDAFPLLTEREVAAIKESARRWIKASPRSSGDPTKDLAFTREAMTLPAYKDVLGFRGTDHMTWDRLNDLVGVWEERGERGDERAASVVKGLNSLMRKLYGGRVPAL